MSGSVFFANKFDRFVTPRFGTPVPRRPAKVEICSESTPGATVQEVRERTVWTPATVYYGDREFSWMLKRPLGSNLGCFLDTRTREVSG